MYCHIFFEKKKKSVKLTFSLHIYISEKKYYKTRSRFLWEKKSPFFQSNQRSYYIHSEITKKLISRNFLRVIALCSPFTQYCATYSMYIHVNNKSYENWFHEIFLCAWREFTIKSYKRTKFEEIYLLLFSFYCALCSTWFHEIFLKLVFLTTCIWKKEA